MKKTVCVAVYSLVCLVLLIIFDQKQAYSQTQTFEQPTYAVGDTWTWKNNVGEITTMTIVEITEQGAISLDNNGKRLLFGEKSPIRWQWPPFPLYVGKKWQFESGNTLSVITVDAKVAKFTTVKTKAGTFEALLIESCWSWTPMNGRPRTECGFKTWYAPAVKRTVKRESPRGLLQFVEKDYELISYALVGEMNKVASQ